MNKYEWVLKHKPYKHSIATEIFSTEQEAKEKMATFPKEYQNKCLLYKRRIK